MDPIRTGPAPLVNGQAVEDKGPVRGELGERNLGMGELLALKDRGDQTLPLLLILTDFLRPELVPELLDIREALARLDAMEPSAISYSPKEEPLVGPPSLRIAASS